MASQLRTIVFPRRRVCCEISLVLVVLLCLVLSTTNALSGSGIPSNANSNIEDASEQLSDRILSPDYYKSVYKNINTNQEQRRGISKTGDDADVFDIASKAGGRTPWDIGNNRPQPAIVRAYEEGKIKGRVLDAGCGVGENCIFLAKKYGIDSITGFDLSEDAIKIATSTVENIAAEQEEKSSFWTTPKFLAASCTDVADRHREKLGITNNESLFDVVIDSGLLHCLSKEDADDYVNQISKLLKPNTGRFYIGCFSTANPDPWDNPRRISEDYLRNELFSCHEKWEILACRDCWWSRPPTRGSSTGGAFSLALWVEVRCLEQTKDD